MLGLRQISSITCLVLFVAGATSREASAAGAVAKFSVQGLPANLTAGVAVSFNVVAQDSTGATVTGYTGTVAFSANDPNATVPANYTFTSADAGVHGFGLTAFSAGSFYVHVVSICICTWAPAGKAK